MSAPGNIDEKTPDGYGASNGAANRSLKQVLAAATAAESEAITNEATGMSEFATSLDKAAKTTKAEMIARQSMSKKEIVKKDILTFPFEEMMEIGDEIAKEIVKQYKLINGDSKPNDPWSNTNNNLNFVVAKSLAAWGKSKDNTNEPQV